VILKPGYAPIEQYDGIPDMKQGAWTDLYALAAVVHFAIAGEPPPPSVRRAMLDTYQPLTAVAGRLPSRYSRRFLAAIDRALARLPGDRPQDVAAWRAMLVGDSEPQARAGRAAGSPPGATPRAPRAETTGRASSRWIALAGLALAAGAALLLGVPRLLSQQRELGDQPPAAVQDGTGRLAAPADAGPRFVSPSVDSRPQDLPHQPLPRPGASAIGGVPDTGSLSRAGVPNPPDEEEHIASAPASVRDSLREARRCLVARRYACTIELAEAVLKVDPGQPVALRLVRQGREGLAGGGWKRR